MREVLLLLTGQPPCRWGAASHKPVLVDGRVTCAHCRRHPSACISRDKWVS